MFAPFVFGVFDCLFVLSCFAQTELLAIALQDEECGLYADTVYHDPSEIEKYKKVS